MYYIYNQFLKLNILQWANLQFEHFSLAGLGKGELLGGKEMEVSPEALSIPGTGLISDSLIFSDVLGTSCACHQIQTF